MTTMHFRTPPWKMNLAKNSFLEKAAVRPPTPNWLAKVLDRVPSMILVAAYAEQKILFANQLALEFFGFYTPETHAAGFSRIVAAIHPDDLSGFEKNWSRLNEADAADWEMRVMDGSGDYCWERCHASWCQKTAELRGQVVLHLFDITADKMTEKELRYKSCHDSLTGLYNRGFYDAEIRRLERGRVSPISVMMMDVDGMKLYNDRYGHGVGDEMLVRVADLLKTVFRQEDIVARIGGDEFAVLLPGCGEAQLGDIVVRMRETIGDLNRQRQIPLRLSVGSSVVGQGERIADCMIRVDRYMYEDKVVRRQ
jgi:diguanylate cyclase (GGDEF)-like protein